MKLLFQLALILSASNAFAVNSNSVNMIESMGLKFYSCELSGVGANVHERYDINMVTNIVAEDEKAALKLCLLKVEARQIQMTPGDGRITLIGKAPHSPSGKERMEILIESIKIYPAKVDKRTAERLEK